MEVDIHHWRTRDGQELDFLVEAGGRIYPVEVKAGLPDARDLVRLERVGDAQWQGGTVLSLVPSEPYALAAGWTARHVTDLSFLRG